MTPQSHVWSPITDLPSDWSSLRDPSVEGIVKVWGEQQDELRSRGALDRFIDKLKRQWAVETGALEEIYRISEGATWTLIEKGLDAALISHEDVDDSPVAVVNKIRDQLRAMNGLYQFVSGQRELSKSYIRELHQVITEHQETYDARDSLGRDVKAPMVRGVWKQLPNNVEGPGGFSFEFCPPEQVDTEIERLLRLHEEHVNQGVSSDVEAAWLHHRFVLIHPFVDGNGRIARCLATLVLLKDHWLPLVVTRKDKPAYIAALRAADNGDLSHLVQLFGGLQRRAVRDALSIGEDTLRESAKLTGMLETLRARFEKQQEDLDELQRRAHRTADSLQAAAHCRLEDAAKEIEQVLRVANTNYHAYATEAGCDSDNAHYNYYQVVQCAKKLGYFANLPAYRSWAALTLVTESRTDALFSFHAIGHGNTGVLACAGMIYSRRTDESGNTVIGDVDPLTTEPFEFTYSEEPENVQKRFLDWLENGVTRAVARWSENLE